MTRPFSRSTGAIVSINVHFLGGFLCSGGGWLAWPSTFEWWQLGVLSILLWTACIVSLGKALQAMLRLWTRARVIAAFEAQGKAPKSSAMAPRARLKAMGMLDE